MTAGKRFGPLPGASLHPQPLSPTTSEGGCGASVVRHLLCLWDTLCAVPPAPEHRRPSRRTREGTT